MHRLAKILNQIPQNTQHCTNTRKSDTSQENKRIVLLGPKRKQFGEDIGVLPNLNAFPSNDAKREQFWTVGYGLFRNLIDRETVLNARNTIIRKIQNKYNIFAEIEHGILKKNISQKDIPFTEGNNDLTHHNDVLNVLENKSIHNIMKVLLNCDAVKTFDYKWLRLIAPGSNTGVHVDNVYMNRGTDRLLTCWIPLMDIKMELGTVFILDGSYYLPSFSIFQSTYGSIDAEKINLNGTGHFTQNPDDMKKFFNNENDYKIRWKSCDFKAGDVLIFTMRTVHMSSVNMSKDNKVRMSCDTRWLNVDEMSDPRYVFDEGGKSMGHAPDKKFGLHNTDDEDATDTKQVTIKQLRSKWGI